MTRGEALEAQEKAENEVERLRLALVHDGGKIMDFGRTLIETPHRASVNTFAEIARMAETLKEFKAALLELDRSNHRLSEM